MRAAGHRPRTVAASLLLAAGLLCSPSAAAHEVPSRVTILAIVRPHGSTLQLLMRVPLGAMRDMEFPLRGAGYLDLARADQALRDAARLWLADYISMYEGDRELGAERLAAVRASLPSDRSFESFADALRHVQSTPLSAELEIPWQQAMLDVLFEYPISSDSARFSIAPSLSRLGMQTVTVLRFLPPGAPERAFQFNGDPGLVRLDPGWLQAAGRFVALGFEHILDGLDHLLFVFCLVIPVRRLRPLVAIVTAFTVAHSITLIASAAGLAPDALWFPPLIEALIALSIVYMAFENIVGAKMEHRWMMAFGFGLVHGFGFSFALRESMQFAGSHLLTSLLAFNVGVELGQLLVVAVAVPVLAWAFRRVVHERMGTILLSALVAHTAWHWMTVRASALREYQWSLPTWDVSLAIATMRFAMLALIIMGVAWGMGMIVRRLAPSALTQTDPSSTV
ncbi:MAG: HupE/UreJ family protein [Gemmatimonadaceae bacterium]